MALDQLTILVNKYRKLSEVSDNKYNDSAVDDAYDAIIEYLNNSNEKIIIKASCNKEVYIKDLSDCEDIIDSLIEKRMTLHEALVYDIQQTKTNEYYIDWDDITFTIEDENGKELGKFN